MSLTFAAQLNKMIAAGLGGAVEAPETGVAVGRRVEYTSIGPAPILTFEANSELPLKAIGVNMEPIQEGSGDPSPENIRPISGWQSVTVTRAGANLLDVTEWMARNGYTGYTVDDDGWITIPAPNEALVYSSPYRFSQLITGSVSIVIDANRTTATNVRVRLYKDDTLVNESSSYLDNRQFNAVAINYGAIGIITFKLMVNVGATHMDWTPTSIQNVTVQLGQTVYGGSLDVTTGEMVVDRAMLVLNTADMNNNDNYPGWRNLTELPGIVGTNVNQPVPATLNIGGSMVGVNTTNTAYGVLYLPTSYYLKTQEEWKALAMDIEILLHYATPITITLTPEQLTTVLGVNNIWSDAGDVSVTYGNIYYTEGY